jgi:hypothetical protein
VLVPRSTEHAMRLKGFTSKWIQFTTISARVTLMHLDPNFFDDVQFETKKIR